MTKVVVEDASGKRFVAKGLEMMKTVRGQYEVVRDEVKPIAPLPQPGEGVEMYRQTPPFRDGR